MRVPVFDDLSRLAFGTVHWEALRYSLLFPVYRLPLLFRTTKISNSVL